MEHDERGMRHKVVIVTGSSRGIGQACARAFLRAGACVVGCADEAEPVDRGEAWPDAHTSPPNAYFYQECDVATPSQVQRLVTSTVRAFGRLDCLVNNAGIHPPGLPIDAFSVEDFQHILGVNLISVFMGCKEALPHLRKSAGTIINMSSQVGLLGQEAAATYCATKGAISGLTKALAIDEARYGVRVNAVCPGGIDTPSVHSWATLFPDPRQKLREVERWAWLNRMGRPEEVAELVLFLASDRSSFITGQDIIMSGGADLGYGLKVPQEVPARAEQ